MISLSAHVFPISPLSHTQHLSTCLHRPLQRSSAHKLIPGACCSLSPSWPSLERSDNTSESPLLKQTGRYPTVFPSPGWIGTSGTCLLRVLNSMYARTMASVLVVLAHAEAVSTFCHRSQSDILFRYYSCAHGTVIDCDTHRMVASVFTYCLACFS